MVITLRKRPQCHYCGERNNPVKGNGRFRCSQCLADNFLDKDGEITDIPSNIAAAPARRYAISRDTRSESSQSIFCSICLKNQLMYTDALSHFLPDPDHPEYDKFEDALPVFKQRLEIQYPQCCAQCEPKVKARLQQATYNARSDHLRRVLEKSRAGRQSRVWGWRSLIVNGAGTGYFTSLFIQLSWHGLGSQSSRLSRTSYLQPIECVRDWPPSIQCVELLESFMILSFMTGVVCIWWNPRWQHKLQGRLGRLVGLKNYYQAQMILMVLRFVAWILLKDVPALALYRPMLHSLSLVLISLLVTYTNLFLIKIDTTPLVNWNQEPIPLLTSGQFVSPVSQLEPSTLQQEKRFQFQSLQSEQQSQVQHWQPPTPPNDEDAMDWAPSTAAFVPQSKKINYKSTQPSPFTGTLPALPKQGIFADKTPNRPDRVEAIGIPPGFFDKSEKLQPRHDKTEKGFAEPKFFPNSVKSDTGLENIFGQVFSLQEHAVEVHSQSLPPYETTKPGIFNTTILSKPQPEQTSTHYKLGCATAVIVLGTTIVLTTLNSFLSFIELSHISTALLACITVPLMHIAVEFTNTRKKLSVTILFLLVAEALALVVLARTYPTPQSVLTPLWTKLTVGVSCCLLIQEIYYFYSDKYFDESIPPTSNSSHGKIRENPERNSNIPPVTASPDGQSQYTSATSDTTSTPYKNSRPRRDSLESVSSTSSFMSTSTASGWKTPVNNHRMEYNPGSTRSTRSSAFNMTNFGSDDVSTGSSIAGPRKRQPASRRGGNAW